MTAGMYSEVFSLFRVNDDGIYICLLCEENLFVNIELEPHALEEHLWNAHEMTLEDKNADGLESNELEQAVDEDVDALIDTESKISGNSFSRKCIQIAFKHIKNEQWQCKKCEKVMRQPKNSFNNLAKHFYQKHREDYNVLIMQNPKNRIDSDEVKYFKESHEDNGALMAWMLHISQRNNAYREQLKNLQKQLDDKHVLYRQIGQDIDYLNEEIDQYRISWLKEQKRIDIITNYLAEQNENQLVEKVGDLYEVSSEVEDVDLNELATGSQPTNQIEDINLEDSSILMTISEKASKKRKLEENRKPVFKVRYAAPR